MDSRERVLAALLTSTTRREAAQKAGVSERTVYDYLRDSDFQRRYSQARMGLITQATAELQRGMMPAVDALRRIVADNSADSRTRITAARALLDFGIRYSEISDVYKRLEELENSE